MDCWPEVLFGGEGGQGPYGFWAPWEKGRPGFEKRYLNPQLGLGCPSVHPRVETPEDSVFPEVGPSLRDMAKEGQGQVEGVKILPEPGLPGPFLASPKAFQGEQEPALPHPL